MEVGSRALRNPRKWTGDVVGMTNPCRIFDVGGRLRRNRFDPDISHFGETFEF